MRIDRALIIRRLGVPESLEYAQICASGCEKHDVPYEYIDGIEFMSSEDAFKAVGVWMNPDQKKQAQGRGVSTGNNNCHASHIKAWRRIVELDRACVIFEHDIIVKGNVCIANIEDMTINIFGHRINDPNRYEPIGPIEGIVKIENSIGGHAYGITPATAQWLINDAEQNGVNINVDEWINLRCGLSLYITDPPQVVCHPRTSTREWVDPNKKVQFIGHTTTFGNSYTEKCKLGYVYNKEYDNVKS